MIPFDDTTLIDPLTGGDWDRSLLKYPNHGFFHTSAWAKVLHRTYGHRPVYFRCFRGPKPVALLPLMEVRSPLTGARGVCLPFSDGCAPLVSEETDFESVVDLLAKTGRERDWKYFEIRGGSFNTAPASQIFYGHQLDLRPENKTLLASFSAATRRAISKAQRSGLTVQILRTRAAVLAYYQLHIRTRRQFGIPPQSLAFFLHIYEEIIKPGLGFIVLIQKGTQSVASAVFFQAGKNAIYKFGASDRCFQELRGNNLAMWEAIRFLRQNGAETVDFGRTSPENDGLRRFKLGWGSVEETIKYHKFNIATGDWAHGKDHASTFHQAFFRRLPLRVNRLLGALLYQHLD
ncbi:MAG: hypothetical protein JWL59_1844 [Chthoniobacteraceae bacterium]|nr:hypothetical protein [Chthoniobacteraceae bacterium]